MALSLVSILLLLFFSSNLFVQRLVLKWKKSNMIAMQADLICLYMKNDMEKTINIKSRAPLTYMLQLDDGDSVIYKIDSAGLCRNGRPLHTKEISCHDLKMEKIIFENPNPFNILLSGRSTHRSEFMKVDISLKLGQKEEMFSFLEKLKNVAKIY